jgi:predicted outer membrane repeat protein
MKKITIRAILFVFVALVLIGCSNIFLEKPQKKEASPQDIPEGFGTVQVSLTQGAARTIMPEPVLNELYLQYVFRKDGGLPETKTPAEKTSTGGRFTLKPGSYTLEVKAYVDSVHTRLAAQSTASTAFTITDGVAAGPVNVTLYPITDTGAGSLEFSLEYPAGVTVETFTLTRIAGGAIDLKPEGTISGSGPITFSGTKTAIPAGYYLLRVTLRDSTGDLATRDSFSGRVEVVHIYQNLKSEAHYVFTADDFKAYLVTNANDSGPGSLRYALLNVPSGQTIRVALEPGSVIDLKTALRVTKNISIEIEGNGVTLTGSWPTDIEGNFLFRVESEFATVKISGVHFNLDPIQSHAIHNTGTLAVESCIFSRGSRNITLLLINGGAISSKNTLTIRGCTFYNTTGIKGGAVYFDAPEKTLTLTGNLFYGTRSGSGYPVVCVENGTTPNASYNVVDAGFGTGTAECGWGAGNGNKSLVTALPISPKTFRLYENGATNVIANLPSGYPAQDFYGNPISNGAAAGAVQESTGSGYYLELSVNNSQWGTVEISPEPDKDGLVSTPFTLTANPKPGYAFGYWQIKGVQMEIAPTSLSEHTWIQIIFAMKVDDFTDGPDSVTTPGTLRYALAYFNGFFSTVVSIIDFSGVTPGTTIELRAPLEVGQIGESLVIKGRGVTLTRAPSWTSPDSLLMAGGGGVKISGVHFKDGWADTGGAIYNRTDLTLEDCTFSGNQSATGNGRGGAIYNISAMTIRDCAFSDNESTTGDGFGGAIYNAGDLLLESCTFSDNVSAIEPEPGYVYGHGGAIYNISILTIRDCAFDGNVAKNYGGAILNTGSLLLESCIFSDNQSTAGVRGYGGAVFSTNDLTIRGCTFYANTANFGGAVMMQPSVPLGKTLTLIGNLFYGNTADVSSCPVVYVPDGTTVNASYNVVDVNFGTEYYQCGWGTGGTGDTTFTALGITGAPFDTTTFVPVSGLRTPGVLPSSAPAGFPTTDFNGATRTFPGAPGAVK